MNKQVLQHEPLIILGEDDENHAELISRSLKAVAENCKIVMAKTGEDVLEELREKNIRPSLILLDINMPKMNGFEVLAIIKSNSQLRYIPVVMLSTSNAESDKRKAYDAHANGFVTKPGDYRLIKQCMLNIKEFWLETNQIPDPFSH